MLLVLSERANCENVTTRTVTRNSFVIGDGSLGNRGKRFSRNAFAGYINGSQVCKTPERSDIEMRRARVRLGY